MSDVNPNCETCGKISYRSIHHARLATKHVGNRVRVYRCGQNWHITAQEKRANRTDMRHKKQYT